MVKQKPIVILPPRILQAIIVTPDGCWRYTGAMTRTEPRTIETVVDGVRVNVRKTLFLAVRGFVPVRQTACGVGGLRCVNPMHSHAGVDSYENQQRFHPSRWNDAEIPAPPPPVCATCQSVMPFAHITHTGTAYVETVAACPVCIPDTYVPSVQTQRLETALARAQVEPTTPLGPSFNHEAVKAADAITNQVARELKAKGHDITPIVRGDLRLRLIERNRARWAKEGVLIAPDLLV